MNVTNKSHKIIGIGGITLLPKESREVPSEFLSSEPVRTLKKLGLISFKETSSRKPPNPTTQEAQATPGVQG